MNIKKIIAIILSVLMVASLAACAGTNAAPVASGVNEDGRFVYTVVRSGEKTIPVVEDAAKAVRAAIKDNFDVGVTITKDTAYEDFEGNLEILVGDTKRK